MIICRHTALLIVLVYQMILKNSEIFKKGIRIKGTQTSDRSKQYGDNEKIVVKSYMLLRSYRMKVNPKVFTILILTALICINFSG